MLRMVACDKATASTAARGVARHQHHVGRLDGDVRPGADGNADIGRGEGRCVIDAVADEGDPAAAGPQPLDRLDLAVGKYLGDHLVDAEAGSDRFGGAAIVARDHRHAQTSWWSASTVARAVRFGSSATARMPASRPSIAT